MMLSRANIATSMRTADNSLSPDIPCGGKVTAQSCFRDAGSVLLDMPNSQLNCTGWREPHLARAEANRESIQHMASGDKHSRHHNAPGCLPLPPTRLPGPCEICWPLTLKTLAFVGTLADRCEFIRTFALALSTSAAFSAVIDW